VFAKHGWNVQELENIVFKDRNACVANIRFIGETSAEHVEKIIVELRVNENILDVSQ